ncbi:MAG: hypothetical protein AUH15_07675 [Acidobacteriales bacterium 13_2_20CM_55_8]|nr:MAG: hypothetical protein AUH15_07675 [Acidobacteriales bacterium 13_2_20CM_55_8]
MIRLKDVSRLYPAKAEASGGVIRALDDFTLSVDPGEWVAIMGPSGSGKSTLVNLIGCLDRPTAGEIWLDGVNVANMSANELNRVRAEKVGFIFQQFHLIPYLTALENVMLAQYFHSMTDEQEALEALARVGLKDRAEHVPAQLSGGEQQRVCIARALINDPKIVLADEPTGNLDAVNEEIVLRLLRELHRQGRTIVMVRHDPVERRQQALPGQGRGQWWRHSRARRFHPLGGSRRMGRDYGAVRFGEVYAGKSHWLPGPSDSG